MTETAYRLQLDIDELDRAIDSEKRNLAFEKQTMTQTLNSLNSTLTAKNKHSERLQIDWKNSLTQLERDLKLKKKQLVDSQKELD